MVAAAVVGVLGFVAAPVQAERPAAESSAPECDGSFSGPGVGRQMLLLACRHAHNVPADDADPAMPVGAQFLVYSTKVRRPGVVRDGELRYVTFTAKRVESGERVTWPMVFRVAASRASVVVGERCRMFSAAVADRPSATERAYITQVAGNGPCPPDYAPARAATAGCAGCFRRGDRAVIARRAREAARAHGWRHPTVVEVLSPERVGTFAQAQLLVTAHRGRLGQCEALARWTPGSGYVLILHSDAGLIGSGTGHCVPPENPA